MFSECINLTLLSPKISLWSTLWGWISSVSSSCGVLIWRCTLVPQNNFRDQPKISSSITYLLSTYHLSNRFHLFIDGYSYFYQNLIWILAYLSDFCCFVFAYTFKNMMRNVNLSCSVLKFFLSISGSVVLFCFFNYTGYPSWRNAAKIGDEMLGSRYSRAGHIFLLKKKPEHQGFFPYCSVSFCDLSYLPSQEKVGIVGVWTFHAILFLFFWQEMFRAPFVVVIV